MKEQAIAKLREEMKSFKNKGYVQAVGLMLIQAMDQCPDLAEKILQGDKSIKKSLDAMREEARKNQDSGVGVLSDSEGLTVVLRYYGVDEAPKPADEPKPAKTAAPAFDLDLDDLL